MTGQTILFTKMHGCGNDYIYVDADRYLLADPAAMARQWSDRRKGIGADGLILYGKADGRKADFSMRIFNADGSEGLMCGNGARCVGWLLYEQALTDLTEIRLNTKAGIRTITLNLAVNDKSTNRKQLASVMVDMMEPSFREQTLSAEGVTLSGLYVSMGNPHFVVFVDDVEACDVERLGPLFEHHPTFPERCNIEFAQILSPSPTGESRIRVRVWERGSGLTQACGTGACAVCVAAAVTGRADRQSAIVMDGGTLFAHWLPNNHVLLTGPCTTVFKGEIQI